jgi:prepilin-type N-terminal cleavage/methylation domain-containing protein
MSVGTVLGKGGQRSNPWRRRGGFTLVEVLAATAVLLVVVVAVGQFFRDSITVWKLGMRRATDNMEARAVLDFISRDINQAVADDVLSMRLDSFSFPVFSGTSEPWYDKWWNDSISFVSLINVPASDAPRAATEVIYYVNNMKEVSDPTKDIPGRYALMRSVKTDAITCYDAGSSITGERWWNGPKGKAEVVVENLGSFEVWCWCVGTNKNGVTYTNIISYNSIHDRDLMRYPDPGKSYVYNKNEFDGFENFQTNRLPGWLEIYLCLLGEDDAVKAAALFRANQYAEARRYVDRYGRRYVIRAYLGSRLGYSANR